MLAILGGGIAGLSAAFEAERRGLEYALFEAGDELGGLSRTFAVGDFRFDAGAHRLHDRDPEVTRIFRDVLEVSLESVHAPSRIHHAGRFVDFPLEAKNLLLSFTAVESTRAALGLLRARLGRQTRAENFEALATQRFGRALAEPLLLKYSEKLWGCPARELSVEIAGRRLDGLGLRALLRGKQSRAHMDGAFLYPRGGIGELPKALAASCRAGALHTRAPVEAIEHDGRRVVAVVVGGQGRIAVEHVLSTLPLPVEAALLRPALPPALLAAARSLEYRQVILVALFISRDAASRYASTYFPSESWPFTRVHEPKVRDSTMAPEGHTSLVAEIACFASDPAWRSPDEDVVGEVQCALERARLLSSEAVIGSAVRRLRNAYPVLSTTAVATADRIRANVAVHENVGRVGRAATFRYLHIHDLVRSALDAVARYAGSRAGSKACL